MVTTASRHYDPQRGTRESQQQVAAHSAGDGREMTSSHTGWFHRTDQGVHWVPASRDTGRSAGSAAGPDPDPARDAGHKPSPARGSPETANAYPVIEVKGRRPTSLDDFLGVTSFAVKRGDSTLRVFGTGHLGMALILFEQQDLVGHGRDIRTWIITTTDHGIVAEPDCS